MAAPSVAPIFDLLAAKSECESVEIWDRSRLVALNVAAATNARDEMLFDCLLDDTKRPPAGLIGSA